MSNFVVYTEFWTFNAGTVNNNKDLLVLKCPDGTLFGLNWASYT